MKAVVQRVEESFVKVNDRVVGRIGKGLNILLGVKKGDSEEDIEKLVRKIVNLRIFEDESGKFQHSLLDIGGEALVVSQFTLYANVKKGRRPSFELAEEPARAEELYNRFVERLRREGVRVETGIFGAMMDVFIRNWGPVTIIVDSEEI
ncbi:D-tyrosyl-tRNA(Tyr) deacylase [Hydrogenivirga caldilitoris]|uniref:D-aminoacyl-tRNA deacylase n=1 Tax=Hydrogenivirga caldilitoris TaxID=246264 RepID=A0A497XNR6_9AQUI|nr:D-aminoacyl-tRNA deacylase [Hydrogenivirga caldilitoris]RLJ70585.1 D-tyrosyl-tRNA(Tyr) deacylase [Hydrogenivirga caldilitoris]